MEESMSTKGSRLLLAAAFGVLLCTFAAKEAEAAPLIYNYGEDVFESGPIPAPFDATAPEPGIKAGYKCNVFGFFWAYVTTWGCTPVAFKDDGADSFTIWEDPEVVAAIAKAYPPDSIKMSFWKHHGRWVLLLVLVVLIVAGALKKKMASS
jgi:hypothetical protein